MVEGITCILICFVSYTVGVYLFDMLLPKPKIEIKKQTKIDPADVAKIQKSLYEGEG